MCFIDWHLGFVLNCWFCGLCDSEGGLRVVIMRVLTCWLGAVVCALWVCVLVVCVLAFGCFWAFACGFRVVSGRWARSTRLTTGFWFGAFGVVGWGGWFRRREFGGFVGLGHLWFAVGLVGAGLLPGLCYAAECWSVCGDFL